MRADQLLEFLNLRHGLAQVWEHSRQVQQTPAFRQKRRPNRDTCGDSLHHDNAASAQRRVCCRCLSGCGGRLNGRGVIAHGMVEWGYAMVENKNIKCDLTVTQSGWSRRRTADRSAFGLLFRAQRCTTLSERSCSMCPNKATNCVLLS